MIVKYKQCELAKGISRIVSWVEEKYAKVNNVCELEKEDGKMEGGWKITRVGATAITKRDLRVKQAQVKNTRKASDV